MRKPPKFLQERFAVRLGDLSKGSVVALEFGVVQFVGFLNSLSGFDDWFHARFIRMCFKTLVPQHRKKTCKQDFNG